MLMKERLELVKAKVELLILKIKLNSVPPHEIQKETSEMIHLLQDVSQESRNYDPSDR